MTIIVTGATGFIGSLLVKRLYSENYSVIILKRSTSDTWRLNDTIGKVKYYDIDVVGLDRVFLTENVDLIVHLATNYGRMGESIEEIIGANITFPSCLLDIATKNGLKGFINTDTTASGTHSIYASTKKAFLGILDYFTEVGGLKTVSLKLEYVYGPRDDDSKFLPHMIKSIINGKQIDASPGMQRRDFIYVDDVVDAYVKCINSFNKLKSRHVLIDIGSGDFVSIKDIALMVEQLTSCKAFIRWGALDYRKNEIFASRADIKNAAELINWKPEHTLEDGLKNTVNWYMKGGMQ